MASYAAGSIFGPALGGLLFDHWGYAAPFAVSGILAFLALMLAVVMVPETRPASSRGQKLNPIAGQTKWRAIWTSLPRPIYLFATLLLIDFIATFAFAFIEPQMALYFYNQLLLTPTQLGLIVGGYGLATLLGQAFLGKLSDRHGRKPVMILRLLLTSTLYLGLIFVTSFGLLFPVAVLSGLGDALFIPAIAASYLRYCRAGAYITDNGDQGISGCTCRSCGPTAGSYNQSVDGSGEHFCYLSRSDAHSDLAGTGFPEREIQQ